MATIKKDFHHDLIETASSYTWTIHNFSSCSYPVGKAIGSRIFSNYMSEFERELKWQLLLYPNGECDKNKGSVSLLLVSLNSFEVTLLFRLSLSSKIMVYFKDVGKLITSRYLNHKWGVFNANIQLDSLLKDLEKGDDILTIDCKMLSFKISQSMHPLNDLQQNFLKLLKTSQYSDVILISKDGNKYKAHKAILSCRSKVFSAMFQHNMKESQDNVVNIKDIDNEILREMLHFIYTGEVINMHNNAKELFIVADKYELNSLKEKCIFHLSENIVNDNVLDLIEFCDIYNICELKTVAKEYFLKNHTEIMVKKGIENLKNLSKNTVDSLLHDLAIYNGSVP